MPSSSKKARTAGRIIEERSPPSTATHRIPDFFELSEYDFEELCEELLRSMEGVKRTSLKNRRGLKQFGVDVEGYSVHQKPFIVLSAKREKAVSKAKLKEWSRDFLDHIDGHWLGKGVERFILASAEDLRGDPINDQITLETAAFKAHAIEYDAWDRREIVRHLRARRDLVETYFDPAWVPRICGTGGNDVSPALAGATGPQRGSSPITDLAKIEALKDRLAEGFRRDFDAAMAEARRWRFSTLDAFIERIRNDSLQWDALSDQDKARFLRLRASRLISRSDIPGARRTAAEAAAFCSPEDRTLEALLLRAEGQAMDALAILNDPQCASERYVAAGLLIELERQDEALKLLGTEDAEAAAPRDGEALRLTMLGWLLRLKPDVALAFRQRSDSSGDDAGLIWAEGVAHFNAALAHGAHPDLGGFPNPIDRSVVREDEAAIRHLGDADRRFEALIGRVDVSERGDLEIWRLAALSSDPTRTDQAERLAQDLLARANPHPGAVAWAISHGFDINVAKIRRSFRHLLAAERGTASHLSVIVALELSLGQVGRAARLLETEGGRFKSPNDAALVQYWSARASREAGNGARPTALQEPLNALLLAAIDGDEAAAARLGKALPTADLDARTVLVITEALAGAGRHNAILNLAPRILSLGTARSVFLVTRAAFSLGDWERVVQTVENGAQAFLSGSLPLVLLRMRVEAEIRLGAVGEALAHAMAAASIDGEEGRAAMHDLAVLHHQLGDTKAAALRLRQLADITELPPRSAVVFARTLRRHDPELARQLLTHAARDLADPGVITEGMRLALDIRDETLAGLFGPAFHRLAETATPESAVRIIDATEAAEMLRETAQDFDRIWSLWLAAEVPLHIAFGARPDIVAHLFDPARHLGREKLTPLLVRPGRSEAEKIDRPIGDWVLTVDVTALLLADAIGLLEIVRAAVAAIVVPASAPEALRALEEVIRPAQPLVRKAEETVLEAIGSERIATVSDVDFGDRRMVRERNDPRPGPTFADLAATLRDRCAVPIDRIAYLLAGEAAGDPSLLDPGEEIVVHAGRLVQIAEADLLDTLLASFNVVVRRSEADAVRTMVATAVRQSASADRLERLRELVAHRLSAKQWFFLPRSIEQDSDEWAGPLPQSLAELLSAPAKAGAEAGRALVAWVEDRHVSGFKSIDDLTTLVTVEGILDALREAELLSEAGACRARLALRRLGYAFLPYRTNEILAALEAAPLDDDGIDETEDLRTIRRHLALQIAASKHAGVGSDFHRPDGRSDDAVIIPHLVSLSSQLLPSVWGRFAVDGRRRIAAADWVLTNLRVDAAAVPPLAERSAELFDRFRIKSGAWLLLQGFGIPSIFVAPGEADEVRWEKWHELVGEYVRFVLSRIVQPIAEKSEANAEALAAVLVDLALEAAEQKLEAPSGISRQRLHRTILANIKILLVQLPPEWIHRLETKPGFTKCFGTLVLRRILVENHAFPADDFWRGVERACRGEAASVPFDESDERATVTFEIGSANEVPKATIVAGGRTLLLKDPSIALVHPDADLRRAALERYAEWSDAPSDRRREAIARICAEPNVADRMMAFQDARDASLTWRLQKIDQCLVDQEPMDWSLLEPPPPSSVYDHLGMAPDASGMPLAELAAASVDRALEARTVEDVAARLAGFPVALPDNLLRPLAGWFEEEPNHLEDFAITPLRARLAATALASHGAFGGEVGDRCLERLADALDKGLLVFRSVLRWVFRQTGKRSDWRDLPKDHRGALGWIFAELLVASFLRAGAEPEGTARMFDERDPPTPAGMYWYDRNPGSSVERSEAMAARAIAAAMIGDVLGRTPPDRSMPDAVKDRLRRHCSIPSGPYAGQELFAMGRPGWSWLDIDPLPDLALRLGELGPDNLSRLDRRGRAELAARELAESIDSDVAAQLVMLIGADALDPETSVDLVCKLRGVPAEKIAEQEVLGTLHGEVSLVLASGIDAVPTFERLKEVARDLGRRHRGEKLSETIGGGAASLTERHLHYLLEIAFALANSSDPIPMRARQQQMVSFAASTAAIVEAWPETRRTAAGLWDAIGRALPTEVLIVIQPDLETIRSA